MRALESLFLYKEAKEKEHHDGNAFLESAIDPLTLGIYSGTKGAKHGQGLSAYLYGMPYVHGIEDARDGKNRKSQSIAGAAVGNAVLGGAIGAGAGYVTTGRGRASLIGAGVGAGLGAVGGALNGMLGYEQGKNAGAASRIEDIQRELEEMRKRKGD